MPIEIDFVVTPDLDQCVSGVGSAVCVWDQWRISVGSVWDQCGMSVGGISVGSAWDQCGNGT